MHFSLFLSSFLLPSLEWPVVSLDVLLCHQHHKEYWGWIAYILLILSLFTWRSTHYYRRVTTYWGTTASLTDDCWSSVDQGCSGSVMWWNRDDEGRMRFHESLLSIWHLCLFLCFMMFLYPIINLILGNNVVRPEELWLICTQPICGSIKKHCNRYSPTLAYNYESGLIWFNLV